MLKRADLAKQFELVVQQEVKNHNDAVLASNILCNKLTKRIDELEAAHDKTHDAIRSANLNLDLRLEKFECFHEEYSFGKDNQEKALCTLGDKLHDDSKLAECRLALLEERISQNEKHLKKLYHLCAQICQKARESESTLTLSLERLDLKLNTKLKALEDELKNAILHNTMRLDGATAKLFILDLGLKDQGDALVVYRKKTDYAEKKIEDLYTQIERLKSRME